MNLIIRPPEEDIPSYYLKYTALAEEDDLIKNLEQSRNRTLALLGTIPETMEDYAYSEGKWSIKQVLAHIIDSERVFAYRALRFSRRDPEALPGFEENNYADNCNASRRKLSGMIEEFSAVRESTILLFSYMTDEMLDFRGVANEVTLTARALGFIMAGHNIHHCNVIREKYL